MIEHFKGPAADLAARLLAGLLRVGGKNSYRDAVNALWERQPVYDTLDIQLVVPKLTAPDPSERPVVERILRAFRLAKRDQAARDPVFLPGGGWQKVLDTAYASLQQGADHDDLATFHYFLSNFGAWDQQTGIEQSLKFRRLAASPRKRLHFEQRVVAQLVHWWQTYESSGRDLSVLALPRHGNFGGARVDGQLILPNSVFSEFYSRLLAGFICVQQPVVGELGGGFGRLCYFLSRQLGDFTYVGLDLPELLCCAAYFLILTFPDKRFLLYGEGDLTADSLERYDYILQPSFEFPRLPDRVIDLFINENSLGAMPPATCRHLAGEICRTAQAIWHRNHELRRNQFEDGSRSLVNREYPIDPAEFRLVARYCDIERLLAPTLATVKNDMYWYYFQRMSR
jgi:hypothetical protein